ncbi:hypothetical protein [Streptomyces sp. NPDC046939]|uniref:hypothetical protein n=1 Tax=Streptomyces sp. NPDC046939 TaxID=3155376 RepID=UPI0033C26F75
MRMRTALTATVLAAIAVLGGAGLASADNGFGTPYGGEGFNNSDIEVSNSTPAVVQFGDLVSD